MQRVTGAELPVDAAVRLRTVLLMGMSARAAGCHRLPLPISAQCRTGTKEARQPFLFCFLS
jgi:hypothetical protein